MTRFRTGRRFYILSASRPWCTKHCITVTRRGSRTAALPRAHEEQGTASFSTLTPAAASQRWTHPVPARQGVQLRKSEEADGTGRAYVRAPLSLSRYVTNPWSAPSPPLPNLSGIRKRAGKTSPRREGGWLTTRALLSSPGASGQGLRMRLRLQGMRRSRPCPQRRRQRPRGE